MGRWIDLHVELFSLRVFIGRNQVSSMILGNTVTNPNIDDEKYLQLYLILTSEENHKIIANRKVGVTTVYNYGECIHRNTRYSIRQSKKF